MKALLAAIVAMALIPVHTAEGQIFRRTYQCNCIMCQILRGEIAGYDWVNGRPVQEVEETSLFFADPGDPVFAPTPEAAALSMLKIAKPKSSDVLVDMGCGDGRILITAWRHFGCRAVGYEIKPHLVEAARKNAKANGATIRVIHGDMFQADLSKVDIVTAYLESELLARLVPQLRQMKAGSKVVTYAHPIPGMEGTRYKLDWEGQIHYFWLYQM